MTLKKHNRFCNLLIAGLLLFGGSSAKAEFGSVEDRLKIQDLWARYVLVLDSNDAENYAGLFIEDAVLNVNNIDILEGRPAILEMINGMAAMMPPSGFPGSSYSGMRHIVTSLVLDIEGDTATGESFWMEVNSGKEMPPSIFNVGRYEDEFVKVNDQWYFSRRDILADTGYVPEF